MLRLLLAMATLDWLSVGRLGNDGASILIWIKGKKTQAFMRHNAAVAAERLQHADLSLDQLEKRVGA
jgi:hypothetical protein